jgi:L-fuculose-phosphate aldolase
MLVDAVNAMAREGLVVGTVGNASIRVGDLVLVTPTRVPYSRMFADDIVPVGIEGERHDVRQVPSRELPLHLEVYRRRPDAGALVHTHSAYATAWSYLDEPLLPVTEENEYYSIGEVRTNPPAPSGSTRLAMTAARRLAGSAGLLLGRHGVLAVGESLDQALDIARVIEHQAKVAWILRSDGACETGL